MMASPVNPLECLPLEMQMEVLVNLSPQDLMNFRLSSRSANAITKSTRLLSFKRCFLSDSTYATVLASQGCYVSEVEVSNLMSVRFGLSRRRGLAVLGANKIIIGSQISDRNLSKILSYCADIDRIGFKNTDSVVINDFLKFNPAMHAMITHLSLNFDISVRNDYREISRRLMKLKLDSLKVFEAAIYAGQEGPGLFHVLTHPQLRHFHKIYHAVHQIVVNHQQTLEELNWNFSGLVPRGNFHPGRDDSDKYAQLRSELYCIYNLKKISVNRFHDEGSEYFNLTVALLLSQKNLVSLSLTTMPSSHTSGIEFILERNKATLKELSLDRPQFCVPLIKDLVNLKYLKVKAYRLYRYWPGYIMTEDDLEEIHNFPVPKGLQELSLEVESLCCENEVDPLHSFICTSLPEVKRLELSLKMENAERHVYPNEDQLLSMLGMPKLEKAVINFFAKYRDGTDTILILERRSALQTLCDTILGLRVKLSDKLLVDDEPNLLYSHQYQLSISINRKIFRKPTLRGR